MAESFHVVVWKHTTKQKPMLPSTERLQLWSVGSTIVVVFNLNPLHL